MRLPATARSDWHERGSACFSERDRGCRECWREANQTTGGNEASRSFVNTGGGGGVLLLGDLAAQVLQEDGSCWTGASSGGKHRGVNEPRPAHSCLISSPLFLLVRTESLLDGAVTVVACMWVKYPHVKNALSCRLTDQNPPAVMSTRASWVVLLEEGSCSPLSGCRVVLQTYVRAGFVKQ